MTRTTNPAMDPSAIAEHALGSVFERLDATYGEGVVRAEVQGAALQPETRFPIPARAATQTAEAAALLAAAPASQGRLGPLLRTLVVRLPGAPSQCPQLGVVHSPAHSSTHLPLCIPLAYLR